MDTASTIPALTSLANRFVSSAAPNLSPAAADPFAEIFARMSVAIPTPPPAPLADPIEPAAPSSQSDEPVAKSSEDDETSQESSDLEESASPVVAAIVAPVQPVEKTSQTATESDENKTASEALSKVEGKQLPSEELSLAPKTESELKDTTATVKPDVAPEIAEQPTDESFDEVLSGLEIDGSKDSDAKVHEDISMVAVEPVAALESNVKTNENGEAVSTVNEVTEERQSDNGTITASQDRPVERRRYSRDQESGRQPEPPPEVVSADSGPSKNLEPGKANSIDVVDRSLQNTTDPVSTVSPPSSTTPNSPTQSAAVSSVAAIVAKPTSTSTTSNATSSSNSTEPVAPTQGGTNVTETTDGSKTARNNFAGADQLSAVQRAKLVQRVSRGFQHLGRDGGNIRLRLSPDELGSVQLDIQIRDGKMRGRMITQTEAASGLLRDQLPELRASLQNQGIQLESLDIQHDPTGQFSNNEANDQRWQDGSTTDQRRSDPIRKLVALPSASQPQSSRVHSQHAGGVDLVA